MKRKENLIFCAVKNYIKTSLRESINHFIIHVETNDINHQNKSPESIVESIVNLAGHIKNQSHDVTISNIAVRKDKWNRKVDKVNNILKELCKRKNISLINNSTSVKMLHFNRSKIHLSKKGSTILGETFVKHELNTFSWMCNK